MNIHQIINSTKMNEALVENAGAMFELEFILKQKAQLSYLQYKKTNTSNSRIMQYISHEFLWTPTPIFYLGTAFVYIIIKRRMKWTWTHFVPMLTIPATMDYFKRDFYIKKQKKEYAEFQKATQTVHDILGEKKQYVTLEQVLTFIFHLNMDNKVDQRKLLPISYF